MVTAAKLKEQTSRELAQLAKSRGVRGWHAMRKEELVKALLSSPRQASQRTSSNGTAATMSSGSTVKPAKRRSKTAQPVVESEISKRIRAERLRHENLKDLSLRNALNQGEETIERDRIALIVRDAWWIQAYWEITRSSVQRAKVALAQQWHTAKPILRLLEVTSDGNTNSVEQVVQDTVINGDARNWFLNVPGAVEPTHSGVPKKIYRVAIGYQTADHKFHLIAKSNEVLPPAPTAVGIEDNWSDLSMDPERFFRLSGGSDPTLQSGELQSVFEDRTRQPVASRTTSHIGSGLGGFKQKLDFEVDAQVIIYGSTHPSASVTVAGEPVRLQQDGSFAKRIEMPNRRQVLPVVALTRDGTQQRTTILAIERNTKVMEAVTYNSEDLA